jgi:peptidoglycan/xylan/chitin deacetylase (PgdA/CDA1 family)
VQLCETQQWPITIYVMALLLNGQQRFWFADLPRVLDAAAGERLAIDGEVVDLTSGERAATEKRLTRRLRELAGCEALGYVDRIAAAAGLPDGHAGRRHFVNADFVRRYVGSSVVSFGSHSVDHQAFSAQSRDQIAEQLSHSRSVLELTLGGPNAHFCYPYGSADAIGPVAPKLAGMYYRSATTLIRGLCTTDSDLFYLPRIALYEQDRWPRVLAKMLLAPAA